jgi:hypothetical protein
MMGQAWVAAIASPPVRDGLVRDVRFAGRAAFCSLQAPGCEQRREAVKLMNVLLLAGIAATGSVGAAEKSARKPAARGVSNSALIAAAKSAMLSEIDYGRELCDGDRDIETWIKNVAGETAARIEWRGGACALTNALNPLDAGSDWCGGATIIPKGHPKEPAAIEIYFEKPRNGKPGKAYAFRAVNYDVDGLDYKRDFPDFEYGYRQKYEKGFVRPEVQDCD